MSGTVDGLALAARSPRYEAIAEAFMPIRIRRHDKSLRAAQVTEAEEIISVLSAVSTACYTGGKPVFRKLWGSIQPPLGRHMRGAAE